MICIQIVSLRWELVGYFYLSKGPGSLTRAILEGSPLALLGIEKDTRFKPFLLVCCFCCLPKPLESQHKDNFRIVFSDALKEEPEGIEKALSGLLTVHESPAINKFQILANLPFSIATPLLVKWLQWMAFNTHPFASSSSSSMEMVLVFQKEVADVSCFFFTEFLEDFSLISRR